MSEQPEPSLYQKYCDRRRVPDLAERYRLGPAFSVIRGARLNGFEEDNRYAGPNCCVLYYRWRGPMHGVRLEIRTENRPSVTASIKGKPVMLSEDNGWPEILQALESFGKSVTRPERATRRSRQK